MCLENRCDSRKKKYHIILGRQSAIEATHTQNRTPCSDRGMHGPVSSAAGNNP